LKIFPFLEGIRLKSAAPILFWLLAGPVMGTSAAGNAKATSDTFYTPPPDTGAALAADAIYPRGRKLAFMGYSGNPARDLTNGFTVAGPVYGNQMPYLEQCFAHGWPVVAHIGPRVTFADKNPNRYKLNEPVLRQQIERQVQSLAAHKEIAWWAVTPEELRPWQSDEMQYLGIVCDAIRHVDPQRRPLYLYNPNHRNAETLVPVARHVDVLAKGCYVNHVGRKRDRAWVRWSVEQEIQAITQAGNSNSIPLLMPELCKDPEPGEDTEIRNWVRHDVYLGLTSGAKGLLIWSLYQRKEVIRTWQLWYNAYSECAKELNGNLNLAPIFLFGQRRSDLQVTLVKGEATANLMLGGTAEPATTSARERAQREIKLAAWTSAEFAYGDSRWLFLVNSANSPAAFKITGWPKDSRAQDAFKQSPIPLTDTAPLPVDLPAYGVAAIRFHRANGSDTR
jgi:hypothetical protein